MKSKVKLVNITKKIGSGSTPKGGKSSYLEFGQYKLIRSQNIYNHYFSKDGLAYISEEQAKKLNNVELIKDDILINITGDSVARVAMVNDDMLPGRVNQHVSIIRCNDEMLYPHFLLAVLTSDEMQRKLLSLAQVGGTRAALTKGMLENLEIDVLSIEKQKYIGDVLKGINDKIENNKNIIQMIEELSQTLFKQWFIDFEFPNEDGLPYKSSGGKMVESELGEIPDRWKTTKIGEISSQVSKGTTPRKKDLELCKDIDRIPFLKVKDISNNGEISFDLLKKIPLSIHENQLKRSKLVSHDILISIAGTIGRISHVPKNIHELNINQAVAFIRLKKLEHFNYIYSLIKDEEFSDYLNKNIVQAVQANVSLTVIKEYQFVLPTDSVISKWYDISNPIFAKIDNLRTENSNLISLRNSLLPKLLSGEIEIPDESVVD